MEMIADIISQHNNITVVNQENQGLSVVRNNGIALAKGEYILMPDSDDLLIENSVPKLLEAALSTKADLIVADFMKMEDEEIEHITTNPPQQKTVFEYQEKTGEQLFLEDLNPHQCYVWRTMFRREFLIENNITFYPGIYIQDVPFTHECYIKAKKCLRTSWLLNIYRKGHESATSSFNIKKLEDFCVATAKTWELTHLEGLSPSIQWKLREDVYTSFSIIAWITSNQIKKASDRTAIFDFLKQQAPDLWFSNRKKQICISYLFKYTPHFYIHIRHLYAVIIENHIRPFFNHQLRKPFPIR
jgi:glycosyltransferase involved in cell wall biosynthesis